MTVRLTGNLINAYYICKRKVWLFAHEINPALDNDFLEVGRIINEQFYNRDKKEILIDNIKIDLIKRHEGKVIIAEVKKSSKGIEAARMQLLFYLYELKNRGISLTGKLLIPKEKKTFDVILDEKNEQLLKNAISDIEKIVQMERPPAVKKISFCRNCAYREFCFSGEDEVD